MELAPDTYQFLKDLKPIALLYALFLGLMVILSMFFQWSFIKFFLDCMMGWTLLSIPFVGVIIVALDKEFTVEDYLYSHKEHHKAKRFKVSTVWGVLLCIAGTASLYYSSVYKKYYGFLCQEFYLEQNTGIYHIIDDCEYIGIDEDDEPIDKPIIVRISGKELLETNHKLCEICEEWAEEAEATAAEYQYRRP